MNISHPLFLGPIAVGLIALPYDATVSVTCVMLALIFGRVLR